MRNFTWIIHWFRRSCRTVPLTIAVAIGFVTASDVSGQEENQDAAPVLRVARPYPELKAPPIPKSSAANTKQSPSVEAKTTKLEPSPSAPPPAQNLSVAANGEQKGGWVARDMVGKRQPLTDPGLTQTAVPKSPAAAPKLPAAANVQPMPQRGGQNAINNAVPAAIPSTQLPLQAPSQAPSTSTSSRRVKQGVVPPSLEAEAFPSQGSASSPKQAEAETVLTEPESKQAEPESGDSVPEVAPIVTQPPIASGWQSTDEWSRTHTNDPDSGPVWNDEERPPVASLRRVPLGARPQNPEKPGNVQQPLVASKSDPVASKSDAADPPAEMSADLQRMLGELKQMKPVARMAPASPAPAPSGPTTLEPATMEPAQAGTRSLGVTQVPRATATEPVEVQPLAQTSPALSEGLARPELATPRVNPPVMILEPKTAKDEADEAELSELQDMLSDQSPALPGFSDRESDIVDSTDGVHGVGESTAKTFSDGSLASPLLESPRGSDIPIRRPSIGSSDFSSGEVSSRRNVATDRPSGSSLDRGMSREPVQDPNSKARNLQEQLEKFERGESSSLGQSDLDATLDSLDSAPEPLQSEPRAKATQTKPSRNNVVVSPAVRQLDQPIRQTLVYFHQRPEKAAQRTPWGMLHAILPFDLDANVDANRRYNAIAYLAGNNPNRNLRMLTVTNGGRLVARTGVGLQGHQAQMLAIFAQVGVPADYPLYVSGRKFVMNDLVKTEMLACKPGEELTFTLIGLSHYLPTDTRWRSADGQMWDFERLLSEEMSQPVVGAACGGTHRLMGLSYALRQRRLENLPITGQWARAETYLKDFEAYAWQLQNRDGSFSTSWFEGRADSGDLDRKMQTTGHILEWLVFVTEDERLQDERVVRSVKFVNDQLLNQRDRDWQVGPKGHALRALSVYHRRVFSSTQPWLANSQPTAQQSSRTNQRR